MTNFSKILDDAVRDGFRKALDGSKGASKGSGRSIGRDSQPGGVFPRRPAPRPDSLPAALELDSLGERP